MRACTVIYLFILCILSMPVAADIGASRPQNIVSINLCTDQYLLAFADPEQIRALTHFARDKDVSFYAERAQHFPTIPTSAELIIKLNPDLVLASKYRDTETKNMLRRFEYRIVEIDRAQTVPQMIEQTRQVTKLIGQEKRGEKLIAELNAISQKVSPSPHSPSALVYQRRGYVSGSGTIVAEMMLHAGVLNQADKMGKRAVSRTSLEEIATYKPDFLILPEKIRSTRDIGSESLHHPVLQRLFREEQFIYMPPSYTVCGGPSFPAAVTALKDAIRKLDGPAN